MSEPSLSFPPFLLDMAARLLRKGKKPIALTPKDFEVLYYLASHPGQIVSTETLLKEVWKKEGKKDWETDRYRGAIKVSFHRIRQALGDSTKNPQYIDNIRYRGYKFIAPVQAAHEDGDLFDSPAGASIIVGRTTELKKLSGWFEETLKGKRRCVFVTGEPGIGKTTVVRAFLRQVAAANTAAIGRGQCIEHYGAGEAYRPVLEALGRLCRAPGGNTLIEWMKESAPTWLVQMPAFLGLAESEALHHKLQNTSRERMLREFSEGIETLSEQRPFILVLEDLQWSDLSTLELLATVARRHEPAKFFVIGTYRPSEMLRADNPLRRVVGELRLHHFCEELALGPLSEEDIAAYLRSRFLTKTLPEALAPALYRRTEGQPLFLVNVVNDLVTQGILVHGKQGLILQDSVETIERQTPETVRLLVAHQTERLLPMERRVLEAASVAGTEFSSAVVAAALETDVEEIEEWSAGLAARQHFVQPAGFVEWPDGSTSERYRFAHALYQHFWHERVGLTRRQRLHHRIAAWLEKAYDSRADEVAAELAVHFEQGRDYIRAVQYRSRAADTAIRRCAHQEAVTHLTKGLELLPFLPETPERTQQELALHTTLGISLQAIRGYGNPVVEQAYARARKLSQQIREPAQLFRVLFGLWQLHLVRAEYRTARELGEQMLSLAQSTHEAGLLTEAHGAVGNTLFHLGEFLNAKSHNEQSMTYYDRAQHHGHAVTYGQDPWVATRTYSGLALWLLGYPDQALQRVLEALHYAQELAHPFSEAFALHDVALIYQFHRNLPLVQHYAEQLLVLARAQSFPFWELGATSLLGWVAVQQGRGEQVLEQLRQSSTRQAIGAALRVPYYQARLAEAYSKLGRVEEGLPAIERARQTMEQTEERWWEAEIHRLRGELLLQRSTTASAQPEDHKSAEASFLEALAVARRQQAKSLELRAATSLSRLWRGQGKHATARQQLLSVYNWFTEGFATADLQEAKTLVEE
jgi:predicted ATPase/DNA-binding winged helix-turn-helix (wHTH) protein